MFYTELTQSQVVGVRGLHLLVDRWIEDTRYSTRGPVVGVLEYSV